MYIYVAKDNIIKMYSNDKIKHDPEIFEIYEVPDEDLQGYSCKYVDGKIVKEKIIYPNKQDMVDKIEKAKDVNELKKILKEYFNN